MHMTLALGLLIFASAKVDFEALLFELRSPDQKVRDAAAAELRESYLASNRSKWEPLVESIRVGTRKTDLWELLQPVQRLGVAVLSAQEHRRVDDGAQGFQSVPRACSTSAACCCAGATRPSRARWMKSSSRARRSSPPASRSAARRQVWRIQVPTWRCAFLAACSISLRSSLASRRFSVTVFVRFMRSLYTQCATPAASRRG